MEFITILTLLLSILVVIKKEDFHKIVMEVEYEKYRN